MYECGGIKGVKQGVASVISEGFGDGMGLGNTIVKEEKVSSCEIYLYAWSMI